MKLSRLSKKRIVAVGLATGIALGTGGIAAAYFGATGSGTGKVTVPNPVKFSIGYIDVGGTTGPGDPSVVTFTITNTSTVKAKVSTPSATVLDKGGWINTHGSPVVGCKWTWFSVTWPPDFKAKTGVKTTGPSPIVLAHTAVHLPVTLHMSNGTGPTGSTQKTCEGKTPAVKLTIGK